MNMKIEIGIKNVFAEETVLLSLLNRVLQAAIGETIFTPDVDIAFIGSEGITGNCHRFEDGVWIALENDAVLESPGLAFVCVANNVFLATMSQADKFPLAPGGEACAAASLQAGFLDG